MMAWLKRLGFLLLALLLFGLLSALLAIPLGLLIGGELGAGLGQGIGGVLAYLAVGKGLERRPLAEIGLGREGMLRHLAAGFLIAFLLMSAVIGALAALGWYRVKGAVWDGGLVAEAALVWLGVAFFEELMTRGLLFRLVEESLGSWIALAVSALFFGVAHGLNPGATLVSNVGIALEAGILLAAAYMLTRSLWLAIGMHWGWNFTQGTLFGANVSGVEAKSLLQPVITGPEWATGGPFGPEAGLLGILAGTGAGVLILLLAIRRGHPIPPLWRRNPS